MHSPRRTLVTFAAAAAGLALASSVALAPNAGSAAPQERTAASSGAKADHQPARKKKKNYVKLDLLALNDFHGNLQPPSGSSGQIGTTRAGGAAFLASLLKKERKKSRDRHATPLTVAAGDLIGGSPLLSAAFHDEPTIKAMNLLNLDVSSVGNHEFDEGVTELLRMQKGGCLPDGPNGVNGQNSCPGTQDFKGADFKYLGANVAWKNPAGHPRPTPFRPYQIFRVEDQKVAFIGMTLEGTPAIVSQAGIADVQFKDEVETANALVPVLRKKGVKSIIVLLHEGGVPTDPTAYNGCVGVSGPGRSIAESLHPQIDAVVSGHTHQPYNCTVTDPRGKPRLFTSASSFGRIVTKLHFKIDPKTHDVVRSAASAKNIINANAGGEKQSTKVNNLISAFNTLVQPISNAVIGHINGANPTTVPKTQEPNGSDSPLGNLIADAQKADPSVVQNGQAPVIALMNPGGIRADLVENAAGEVTYGAAFTVQPFNNFVVSMNLTGAQIRALLNEQWNGANETSRKILEVSGIQYTWDKTIAGPGSNDALVGDVMVDADGNEATPMVALADATTYRVVANSFLSDGGDGFSTFKSGTNKLVGGLDIDSLRIYLQAHDPYTVTATDRISSVN